MRIKVALLALLGFVAAGASCSHDPDPVPVPTGPASTSPTLAPPPEMPAKAREDSPAGAESFARYWLEALNYAYQSGATELLRSLGACASCVGLSDGIDRFYGAGGHIDGGVYTVVGSKVQSFQVDGDATVLMTYDRAKRIAIDKAGKETVVPAEKRARMLATLGRSGTGWFVRKLQVAT